MYSFVVAVVVVVCSTNRDYRNVDTMAVWTRASIKGLKDREGGRE